MTKYYAKQKRKRQSDSLHGKRKRRDKQPNRKKAKIEVNMRIEYSDSVVDVFFRKKN